MRKGQKTLFVGVLGTLLAVTPLSSVFAVYQEVGAEVETQGDVRIDSGDALRASSSANMDAEVRSNTEEREEGAEADTLLEVGIGAEASQSAVENANERAHMNASLMSRVRAGLSTGEVATIVNLEGDTETQIQNEEDVKAYGEVVAKHHTRVERAEVRNRTIEVHFRDRVQFFGFVPVSLTARTVVDAEGNVEVKYPWYAAFATGKNTKASVESRVRASLEGNSLSFMTETGAQADVRARETARALRDIAAAVDAAVLASASADAEANL